MHGLGCWIRLHFEIYLALGLRLCGNAARLVSFVNALSCSVSLRQGCLVFAASRQVFKAWGLWLVAVARRRVVRLGTLGQQIPNQSFKRTASPPLNSSVRR